MGIRGFQWHEGHRCATFTKPRMECPFYTGEEGKSCNQEYLRNSDEFQQVYEDRYTQSRAEYTAERSRVYGSTNKPTQRARASKDSTAATAQVRREAAAAAAT